MKSETVRCIDVIRRTGPKSDGAAGGAGISRNFWDCALFYPRTIALFPEGSSLCLQERTRGQPRKTTLQVPREIITAKRMWPPQNMPFSLTRTMMMDASVCVVRFNCQRHWRINLWCFWFCGIPKEPQQGEWRWWRINHVSTLDCWSSDRSPGGGRASCWQCLLAISPGLCVFHLHAVFKISVYSSEYIDHHRSSRWTRRCERKTAFSLLHPSSCTEHDIILGITSGGYYRTFKRNSAEYIRFVPRERMNISAPSLSPKWQGQYLCFLLGSEAWSPWVFFVYHAAVSLHATALFYEYCIVLLGFTKQGSKVL